MVERKSLYTELKRIGGANENIAGAGDKLTRELKGYETLEGYDPMMEGVDLPVIDVLASQRKAIESYAGNPYIERALQRDSTLEQSVTDMHQINKGIRRYLPRRKNAANNENVENLDEILGVNSIDLVSNGVLYPDNPVFWTSAIGSGYAGVGFFIPTLIELINKLDKPLTLGDSLQSSVLLGGMGAIFGAFTGWVYRGNFGKKNEKERLERARYLDHKINELFGLKNG